MKKSIIAFFLVLFVTAAIAANYSTEAFASRTSTSEFNSVYKKALELNKDRFADLDIIQIGDTVLFPSRIGLGTEAWVANYPSNGKHDCIWYLTQKYLAGQLITAPVDTIRVKAIEKPKPSIEESSDSSYNIWWFIILLLLVIAFTIFFTRLLFTRRPTDLNQSPVIPGGLSNDQPTALGQLNAAYPNRPRALRIQRGVLAGPAGVSSVKISMTFSDGVRQVTITSGEVASKVEREGNIVDYYRQHCGNLMGEVANGRYILPEGWSFIPSSPVTENIPVTETHAPIPAPIPAPVEEFKLEPSGAETTAIIEALSKLSASPKIIMYGDLVIEFQKEKKRRLNKV